MIEWVLDNCYQDRFHLKPESEKSVFVWSGNEGSLLSLMKRLEKDYAGVLVFSLPSFGDASMPAHVELGIRGEPVQVTQAFVEMCKGISALGFEHSPGPVRV